MADLNFPTLNDIVKRMQTDFQNELPQSNPYLPNSYIKAFITSLAGRFYENYNQLNSAVNDLYPNTSEDEFVELWGKIFQIFPRVATQAEGNVTSTGIIGTIIPAGTILVNSNGDQYTSLNTVTIESVTLGVSLNRTGNVVTANTGTNKHYFATNTFVTISGATTSEFNGNYQIIALDDYNFTYTLVTIPTEVTDTATANSNLANIQIQSNDFGSDQNLSSGEDLDYLTLIPGVTNNKAYVQIDGVTGGQDAETSDEYRERILFRFAYPVAQFSSSAIEAQAFLIEGVTRVWVQSITPQVGQVTIYFVRDNDPTIIPTASEVQQVRDSILLIQPASTNPNDIIVAAPQPVYITFNFLSISPDTDGIKNAVKANLQQYFLDNAGVDDNLLQLGYNSAIFNTIDPNTGQKVTSFSLSSPTGDIGIDKNQIGILQDVLFN